MSLPGGLRDVLGAGVRVRALRVGLVTGVLLDASSHVIGLEVTSGDVSRFLPWAVAVVADGVVEADSALLLVDSCEAYVERGAVLCRDPEELGALESRDVALV